MSEMATLSAKFQISIPKAVREKEAWHPGQKFAFVPNEGGYLLVPVPTAKDLRGLAKGASRDAIRDRSDRF
jgi:AbrB family looped-hinge helix DNA binding protein